MGVKYDIGQKVKIVLHEHTKHEDLIEHNGKIGRIVDFVLHRNGVLKPSRLPRTLHDYCIYFVELDDSDLLPVPEGLLIKVD